MLMTRYGKFERKILKILKCTWSILVALQVIQCVKLFGKFIPVVVDEFPHGCFHSSTCLPYTHCHNEQLINLQCSAHQRRCSSTSGLIALWLWTFFVDAFSIQPYYQANKYLLLWAWLSYAPPQSMQAIYRNNAPDAWTLRHMPTWRSCDNFAGTREMAWRSEGDTRSKDTVVNILWPNPSTSVCLNQHQMDEGYEEQ